MNGSEAIIAKGLPKIDSSRLVVTTQHSPQPTSGQKSSSSFALMLGSQGLHLHNGLSSNVTVRVTLCFHLPRSPRRS